MVYQDFKKIWDILSTYADDAFHNSSPQQIQSFQN